MVATIVTSDLTHSMSRVCCRMFSHRRLHKVFRAFDLNSDRRLDQHEFARLLASINAYVRVCLPTVPSQVYFKVLYSVVCIDQGRLVRRSSCYPFTHSSHRRVVRSYVGRSLRRDANELGGHSQADIPEADDGLSNDKDARFVTRTAGFVALVDPDGTGEISVAGFSRVFLGKTVRSILMDPANSELFFPESGHEVNAAERIMTPKTV